MSAILTSLGWIAERLPESASGYAIELAIGFVLAFVLGSFFEYAIHRFVMHSRGVGESLPPGASEKESVYHKHSVLHHGTFYRRFDLEEDPIGKELNIVFTWDDTLTVLLALSPAIALLAYLSPVVAAVFVVFPIAHNRLWNALHREMHIPRHGRFTRTSVYRFLARHHYMHHEMPGTNFNVVLPLADFVLATSSHPKESDEAELRRLGYRG